LIYDPKKGGNFAVKGGKGIFYRSNGKKEGGKHLYERSPFSLPAKKAVCVLG